MTVSPEKIAEMLAATQWQILLEKDDRTSPEEYPDMALITSDELASVVLAAINEALETGVVLPKLENCGHYIAEDNKGAWHYVNHANTWQTYPGPQTPEALAQLSGITDETSSGDRAVELASAELIKAGDALSFAAQTSGGTAGRDDALVAAIDGWAVARDKLPRRRLSQTSRPTHDQS